MMTTTTWKRYGGHCYSKFGDRAGRPRLRLQDHNSRILRCCNITFSDVEESAGNRDEWSSMCNTGLTTYSHESTQAAKERRSLRNDTCKKAFKNDFEKRQNVKKRDIIKMTICILTLKSGLLLMCTVLRPGEVYFVITVFFSSYVFSAILVTKR